jgi:hypothetical protein
MKSFKDYLREAEEPVDAPADTQAKAPAGQTGATTPQMPTTPGGPPPEAPKPANPPAPVNTTDVTKMDTNSLYQKYTQIATALQSTKSAAGEQTPDPKTKQVIDTMQKQSLEAATELKKRGYSDQQLAQNDATVKETSDILRLSGVKEAGPTNMAGRVNNMFTNLNNAPPTDNPEMDAIGAQQRAQIQQRMAASATKVDTRRAEQEKLRLQRLAGIQPTPGTTPPAAPQAGQTTPPARPQGPTTAAPGAYPPPATTPPAPGTKPPVAKPTQATTTPPATPDEYAPKRTGAYQAAQQQYGGQPQAPAQQKTAPQSAAPQPAWDDDIEMDPKFNKYPNAKAEFEKARAAAKQVNPNIVPRSQATDDDW